MLYCAEIEVLDFDDEYTTYTVRAISPGLREKTIDSLMSEPENREINFRRDYTEGR